MCSQARAGDAGEQGRRISDKVLATGSLKRIFRNDRLSGYGFSNSISSLWAQRGLMRELRRG